MLLTLTFIFTLASVLLFFLFLWLLLASVGSEVRNGVFGLKATGI